MAFNLPHLTVSTSVIYKWHLMVTFHAYYIQPAEDARGVECPSLKVSTEKSSLSIHMHICKSLLSRRTKRRVKFEVSMATFNYCSPVFDRSDKVPNIRRPWKPPASAVECTCPCSYIIWWYDGRSCVFIPWPVQYLAGETGLGACVDLLGSTGDSPWSNSKGFHLYN